MSDSDFLSLETINNIFPGLVKATASYNNFDKAISKLENHPIAGWSEAEVGSPEFEAFDQLMDELERERTASEKLSVSIVHKGLANVFNAPKAHANDFTFDTEFIEFIKVFHTKNNRQAVWDLQETIIDKYVQSTVPTQEVVNSILPMVSSKYKEMIQNALSAEPLKS